MHIIIKIIILGFILAAPVHSESWHLPPCNNTSQIILLQELADSYYFKYKWKEDVFDCVDLSAANWRFLKAHGYDPKIAIRFYAYVDGHRYSHCYVVVPVEDGWLGLDTQGVNLSERIGKVITELEMWKLCDTPEEVFAIDRRGPPVISGVDAIRPKGA